jgi:DNA-binding NarL/FixJ family response regulator
VTTTPVRVLLVDDHEHVRRLAAIWLLDDPRFALSGEAGDAADAVDLVERLTPDAVLLDLHLPGANGLTALRFIKERHPSMVVVVLTADESLVDEAARRGADAVFVKGHPLADVLETVHDHVHTVRSA